MDPYIGIRENHPFAIVAYYTGLLKCMDIVEPYHPDRFLRQFGRVQNIPPPPLAPLSRGSTAGKYCLSYKYVDRITERWKNHVLSEVECSEPVIHPWDYKPNYMD